MRRPDVFSNALQCGIPAPGSWPTEMVQMLRRVCHASDTGGLSSKQRIALIKSRNEILWVYDTREQSALGVPLRHYFRYLLSSLPTRTSVALLRITSPFR